MDRRVACVLAYLAASAVHVGSARAADGAQGAESCDFFRPGGPEAPAAGCLRCHAHSSGATAHPVDLDYEQARTARHTALRPSDEVLRRGVFLPGGVIRCGTCHDPRSPWKDHLALPPGAAAARSVNPLDRSTYEEERVPPSVAAAQAVGAAGQSAGGAARAQRPAPPAGSAVSPTPLCMACHDQG